jgi:hypothetical protein
MMRNIFIICLLIYSYISFGQDYHFKEANNCKIEIVLEDLYFGDSTILGDTVLISYFDKSGNKTKTIDKFEGQISSMTNYSYNKFGQLIESKNYGALVGNVPYKDFYVTHLDSSIMLNITKYQYENGLLKRTDVFSNKNELEFSKIIEYDSNKRIIKVSDIDYTKKDTKFFNPKSNNFDIMKNDKKNVNIQECKYLKNLKICSYSDSSGLLGTDTAIINNDLVLKSISYNSKGQLQCISTYKYDNNNLIEYSVKGCELDMFPPANRFVYEYDNDGFLISINYYDENKLLQKNYYKRIK